jgi:hypothetical protein
VIYQSASEIILHTLVSNIIRIISFDGSGDLSLIVGNNIKDVSHDNRRRK